MPPTARSVASAEADVRPARPRSQADQASTTAKPTPAIHHCTAPSPWDVCSLAVGGRFPAPNGTLWRRGIRRLCDTVAMAEIPAQLIETFKLLDADVAQRLTQALEPVAGELGPREEAVLERLVRGIAEGAPAAELNAFVRLLPVTVSRAVQPAIEPVTA